MSLRALRFHLAEWLSTHLPDGMAYRWAEGLGALQWRTSAMDRRAVQANLELALGRPIQGHAACVGEVFKNFGRYLVEFLTAHRAPEAALRVEGFEHLEAAQRHGRGAIVLSAHLGNWEFGAVVIHRMGCRIAVVALPHLDRETDRLFNAQRERCGVGVVPLGPGAAHECLRRLRAGELLAVLGDRVFVSPVTTGLHPWHPRRPFGTTRHSSTASQPRLRGHGARHGMPLTFCGRQVTLPSGPAMLSLRSRAPIVPTFMVREGRGRFRLYIEPPIWPDGHGAAGQTSVRALAQTCAGVLERYVKAFPSQWLLFQPIAGRG